MTTSIEPQNASQIETEACAWLAQLETGDLSPEDLAGFREWINRSPRHASAIRDIAALSADLNILTELNGPLFAFNKKRGRRSGTEHRAHRWTFAAKGAVAFSMVFALAFIGYLQFFMPVAVQEFYSTDVGDYQTVALSDGSIVKLNTNTTVEIVYGAKRRQIRLVKGEAFFDVTEDPTKPFIVLAGAHYARAVGTAFVVRLQNDSTELIVTEGVVEFSQTPPALTAPLANNTQVTESENHAGAAEPVLVEAGYEATSQATGRQAKAIKLSARAQERKLSWTEGLFDFSDTPLSDVVAEVSRHTDIKIEIADAALNDVKFGGVFRVADIDVLLDSLPNVGVRVEYLSDKKVLLTRSSET
jgi:transmembrane sensor